MLGFGRVRLVPGLLRRYKPHKLAVRLSGGPKRQRLLPTLLGLDCQRLQTHLVQLRAAAGTRSSEDRPRSELCGAGQEHETFLLKPVFWIESMAVSCQNRGRMDDF